VQVATRACNALADALVLLVTWRVTYKVVKLDRSLQGNSSLASLFLRDGSLYFGVLLILNILNASLWVVDVYQNLTVFSDVFSVILVSHFFLNLRKTALNPETGVVGQSSEMSDLRFSGALGDLGSVVAGSPGPYGEENEDEEEEWADGENEASGPGEGLEHPISTPEVFANISAQAANSDVLASSSRDVVEHRVADQ